jgi:hypothetical protein
MLVCDDYPPERSGSFSTLLSSLSPIRRTSTASATFFSKNGSILLRRQLFSTLGEAKLLLIVESQVFGKDSVDVYLMRMSLVVDAIGTAAYRQ